MVKSSFSAKKLQAGFSLVELLVVVAIFIIITSVILLNQNRFSSNSAIQNLAYQIALSIRQAQVYGLSVRGTTPNSSATFDTAFGIHFNKNIPNSFKLFADWGPDGKPDGIYDCDVNDDCVEDVIVSTFKIEGGNSLYQIYTTDSLNGRVEMNTADISFRRPNPEAIITDNDYNPPAVGQKTKVEIIVRSSLKDRTQTVWVTQPGQIYVTN